MATTHRDETGAAAQRRRPALLWLAWLGLCCLTPTATLAHAPGLGAALLQSDRYGGFVANVTYAWADLAALAGSRADPPPPTAADWQAARSRLTALAVLQLEVGGEPRAPSEVDIRLGAEDSVEFRYRYPSINGALTVSAPVLAELPRGQRLFVEIRSIDGAVLNQRLLAAGSVMAVTLHPDRGRWALFGTLFGEGLHHIWIGYDHLAFLMLLLLPALSSAQRRDGWLQLVQIVTVFSIAHSVSLSAAALGWVRFPERPVEIAIALSVVLAGFVNLVPSKHRYRAVLAGGFGLLHGLGFASALGALGVAEQPLLALLGFNLGVEAGQLCIVAAAWPAARLLLDRRRYSRWLLPAGSMSIAALAAGWLVERIAG